VQAAEVGSGFIAAAKPTPSAIKVIAIFATPFLFIFPSSLLKNALMSFFITGNLFFFVFILTYILQQYREETNGAMWISVRIIALSNFQKSPLSFCLPVLKSTSSSKFSFLIWLFGGLKD